MKNALKWFMFAGLLVIPAVAFGQGSGSTYEPSRPSPGSSENRGFDDDRNLVITKSVSGSIIGLKDGILSIKTQKGAELTIAVARDTKFKIGKKSIDAKELDNSFFSTGNAIKVTYKPLQNNKVAIDKVAVEIRFAEEKEKTKPVLGT